MQKKKCNLMYNQHIDVNNQVIIVTNCDIYRTPLFYKQISYNNLNYFQIKLKILKLWFQHQFIIAQVKLMKIKENFQNHLTNICNVYKLELKSLAINTQMLHQLMKGQELFIINKVNFQKHWNNILNVQKFKFTILVIYMIKQQKQSRI